MRGLTIALREAPLALTDSEPFAESQLAKAYAKLVGGFTDPESMLLLKHAPMLRFDNERG